MLQAMNTGHDGSLTTIHANDTRDALSRLEMMVGMAGFDLPIWIIRRQIASAIHIIIQVARLSGGVRRIVKISEVTGMEGEVISMHDIFTFNQTGIDKDRRAIGQFKAEGIRPHCLRRLAGQRKRDFPGTFRGACPRDRVNREGQFMSPTITLGLTFGAVASAVLGVYSIVTDLRSGTQARIRRRIDESAPRGCAQTESRSRRSSRT